MSYEKEILKNYQILSDPNLSLHRQVKSIVSSYNSPWDPLTELIQNSVDAINQRKSRNSGSFQGEIRIVVDQDSHTITVEDNGIGIEPGNCSQIILPGGSFKDQGNTYGHKGLGFTYCAHIAENIEVETQTLTSQEDHWRFVSGFDWLINPNEDTAIQKSELVSFRAIEGPGTSVRIKFKIGDYEKNIANTAVLDSIFEWANDAKLMKFVLQTRTAIGQVGWLFGESPPVDIDVTLVLQQSGIETDVPYKFFDFFNLPPFNQQTYPKATDYATNVYLNHKQPNKVHHGIYHVFDQDFSNPAQPLKVGRNKGGVRFSVFLYACGKKNLSEALQQYDPRLGNEFRKLALTTDVHLAIEGMPCGVPIDSWNNYGHHEQRYFAMINAELRFGTVLDAGRKTITRYYVDLLTDKTIDMAKNTDYFGEASFHELSMQLHTTSTMPLQRGPIQYIEAWKELPSLSSTELLLREVPNDELGVYILFAELVGRGLIPGYQMLYVSGAAIYDAAFRYSVDLRNTQVLNPTVEGGEATLGIGNALVQQNRKDVYAWNNPVTGQEHLVAEFKVSAQDLLTDIQKRRSDKDIRHIDMLICISSNQDEISKHGGSIIPVTDAARKFSGVTHILSYGGQDIQVICLDDAVNKLVDSGELS
jgi:hypothetical protein